MLLFKIFLMGLVIAVFSYIKVDRFPSYGVYDVSIFPGLLLLITLGLFGLIWNKQSGRNDLRYFVGIALIAFLPTVFLAESASIGIERMSAILLSFIAVGIFGLMAVEKNNKKE